MLTSWRADVTDRRDYILCASSVQPETQTVFDPNTDVSLYSIFNSDVGTFTGCPGDLSWGKPRKGVA